jgi:hypothetical protein
VDKPNETFMTIVCPICKSSAQELPRTGDATGFHCPTHGDFKVTDTVFAEAKTKDYTREQWEAALDKAEQRAEPDEWPLIVVDDFYLAFLMPSPRRFPPPRTVEQLNDACFDREGQRSADVIQLGDSKLSAQRRPLCPRGDLSG